jgi:sec-independent protein translocase protein TatA
MAPILAFGNLGWPEILIILVVALLLFGRRLPEVGRSLGQGLLEFKRGLKDVGSDVDSVRREVDQAGREVNDAIRKEDKPAKPA